MNICFRYGYFMEDDEAEEEAQYTKNGARWEAEELIKEANAHLVPREQPDR